MKTDADKMAAARTDAYQAGIQLGARLVDEARRLGLSEEQAEQELFGAALLAARVELERLTDGDF